MWSRIFIFHFLLGICLATLLEFEPLSDAEIFYINDVQSSWRAGRNFEPEEFKRVEGLLSVNKTGNKDYKELHRFPESNAKIRDYLPKEFDSRKKWPNCTSISEIRDQSACASGWALAPAEAMTDRMCIHTKTPVHISAEDILACCTVCGDGCQGGNHGNAWFYIQTQGAVSGGNYDSSQGCKPYSLPKCDHHVMNKYQPCNQTYPTPKCEKKCRKGYPKVYVEDKQFADDIKGFHTEKDIMQEIVDNGPVSAIFDVYSDFLSYKSGVYKHTTGKKIGENVVKIIGYGTEQGQAYWIVANSWNEYWGDKGFFKVSKGKNECRIEEYVVSAYPIWTPLF